ncbi:hypothetical protein [Sunxiuqinia elliptica]|uniref:Uncharacterized protein n=1 Tax=Sunxiuqinia elliptica TaxID=655355 RepID=A0A4R6HAK9_9BACT|nr:hypothetical protein [Sunxiuqinia elliptica]TDO04736.1 hypothetical protein DET52_10184 [Sunxiuqinia elliptica]TDO64284.1 hypothetical protein DET65_0640 [Sunxiuqinia elliptica]
MSKNLSDNINELSDVTKKYVQTRIDLVKLTVLSKATQVTSYLISNLILALGGALILFFVLAAFVVWYGQTYGDYLTGLLLAIGVLVVLFVLFALFRNQLISSMVLRKYSSMLFEEEEEEEEL